MMDEKLIEKLRIEKFIKENPECKGNFLASALGYSSYSAVIRALDYEPSVEPPQKVSLGKKILDTLF